MKDLFYRYRYLFLTIGVLSVIILSLFYNALKPEKQLPIYTPAMVNPELVDSLVQHQNNKMKHKIAEFSFQNQNNKTITQKEYENVIYVADLPNYDG
jgi:protein SCO1/2